VNPVCCHPHVCCHGWLRQQRPGLSHPAGSLQQRCYGGTVQGVVGELSLRREQCGTNVLFRPVPAEPCGNGTPCDI
jgi:hypothetical protein